MIPFNCSSDIQIHFQSYVVNGHLKPVIWAWPGLRFHHTWANFVVVNIISLWRKQPTFGDATSTFSMKWRVRNERRNSVLMTCHYRDLGSVSDWLEQIPAQHNQSETLPRSGQWRVISIEFLLLFLRRHFAGKLSGRVAKGLLFSQANLLLAFHKPLVYCNKFSFFLSLSVHCIFPLLIFRSGTFGSMVDYGCEFKFRLAATMCIGLPFGVLLEVK